MRLRNVKNAIDILNDSKYFIKDNYLGKWADFFKNNNKIALEVGCGKGTFLIEMAKEYPDINFIGIEKYESVLVRAIEKVNNLKLNNLYFMCVDAKELNKYFKKEVDTIYLNFSDPWPKKRHAKRRLTSPDFLKLYDDLFINDALIIAKTDNDDLFNYSLLTLKEYGYIIDKVSYDLHQENIDNVETEYEEKFAKEGIKIKYLKAHKTL